jgi:Ca-activated chloride channel family protein
MFKFEYSNYLQYLAGLIPLGILLYFGLRWYLGQKNAIGESRLINQLSKNVTWQHRKWGAYFPLLILTFFIIALSNPQWGSKREKVKARSADIFIALDISNSMYCQDIAPNRLERAKRFASKLVDELKGERIGLILFAGNAYLQMPLTTDYAAAKLFIQSAHPGLAATQGTAIGESILTVEESFAKDNNFHKALIIITDGEDHDADALSIAEQANQKGLIIFPVGVGSAQGSFIPVQVNGKEDWKRDLQGQPVRTRLNETLLKELAIKGGGEYLYLSDDKNVLDIIDRKVEQLEKREYEERSFTAYESYFQFFLGLGLLLWVLEWLFYNYNIFKNRII